MNYIIQRKKEFRNPSIYEKLIQFCAIDELGTNYPKVCPIHRARRAVELAVVSVTARHRRSTEQHCWKSQGPNQLEARSGPTAPATS